MHVGLFDRVADLLELVYRLPDQLSDEDLTQVAEVFIAAENVDDIKCMLLNKKQPRLTCIMLRVGLTN